MKCNLCGVDASKEMYERNGYNIVKCSKCSLVYVNNQPTMKELKDLYSDYIFIRGDKYNNTILNDRLKLDHVLKYIQDGSLLDVGAATGNFMYTAIETFNVDGVELSQKGVDIGKEHGLNIVCGDVTDINYDAYNVVTMWDVIEHLKDPNKTIQYINKLLTKDGFLFITTGNVESSVAGVTGKHWYLMTPPAHLFYFSEETITKLLEQNNFKVLDIKYIGKQMELRWILFKIADTFNNKVLFKLYEYMRNTWMGKLRFNINFYDIMTITAQKASRE